LSEPDLVLLFSFPLLFEEWQGDFFGTAEDFFKKDIVQMAKRFLKKLKGGLI